MKENKKNLATFTSILIAFGFIYIGLGIDAIKVGFGVWGIFILFNVFLDFMKNHGK